MSGIDRGSFGVGACRRGECDGRDAPRPRGLHEQNRLRVDGALHLTDAISLEHIEKAQQVALCEGGKKQLFRVPTLNLAVKGCRCRAAQRGFVLCRHHVTASLLPR